MHGRDRHVALTAVLLAAALVAAGLLFAQLVTLVGAVVVGTLLGFLGLFVAIPILSLATIAVRRLWIEPMERRTAEATQVRARTFLASAQRRAARGSR